MSWKRCVCRSVVLVIVTLLGLLAGSMTQLFEVPPDNDVTAYMQDDLASVNSSADVDVNTTTLPPETTPPTTTARHRSNGGLAIITVGVEDRMLWWSKLRRVIEPTVEAGFDVDWYVSLVGHNRHGTHVWRSVENTLKSFDVEGVTDPHATVRESGATLKYYAVLNSPEDVEADLPLRTPNDGFELRMQQYSPLSDDIRSANIGQNVLRRYKSLEHLARMAFRSRDYDFTLVTRDNDQWLGKFDISWFRRQANWGQYFYSKDCNAMGGINDKTFLFGRKAAKDMLFNIYSDWWLPNVDFASFNAEAWLRKYVRFKKVRHRPVAFSHLPTADTWYVKVNDQTVACQARQYLCNTIPSSKDFDKPTLCNWTKAAKRERMNKQMQQKNPQAKPTENPKPMETVGGQNNVAQITPTQSPKRNESIGGGQNVSQTNPADMMNRTGSNQAR